MIQAENQMLGSPVNRINILARASLSLPLIHLACHSTSIRNHSDAAVAGLSSTTPTPRQLVSDAGLQRGLGRWLRTSLDIWLFRVTLWAVDIGFWATKVRQFWYGAVLGRKEGEGFEDIVERQSESRGR